MLTETSELAVYALLTSPAPDACRGCIYHPPVRLTLDMSRCTRETTHGSYINVFPRVV